MLKIQLSNMSVNNPQQVNCSHKIYASFKTFEIHKHKILKN